MTAMQYPTADYPVRRYYEIVDSESVRLLSDQLLFNPADRTLALALADAVQEFGTDRSWAIQFAARVRLSALRAGRIAEAVRVIGSDSRRGRMVRRLVRYHVHALSDRVPIDVVYGWREPTLTGEVGRTVVELRDAMGRVRRSRYQHSTLRITVGSQWVLRHCRLLAAP